MKYFKSNESTVFFLNKLHSKMSTAIITAVSKHTWSREETTLVTRAFLDGKSIEEARKLVPNIKLTSVKQKYTTCASLNKKNMTKLHQDVWDELKAALAVPDVEAVSTVEDQGYWSEDREEDDETYFKCTGTCGRVCHYEETNGEGMCGKCEFHLSKSRRK